MIDENDSIELTDVSIDIKKRIESLVSQARKCVRLEVNDDKGYQSAALDIKRIAQFKKDLETLRKRAVTPLNNKVKAINQWFRGPADYLSASRESLSVALLEYSDKKAKEAQRQAEIEAKRLLKNAEKKAKLFEKNNDEDAAVEQRERAGLLASMTIASVDTRPPKEAGISTRYKYSAVVIDMPKLVSAVANGEVPKDVIIPNMPELNRLAKALKMDLKIPGVGVNKIPVMSVRP